MFSLILGLRPARDFASLSSDIYCLNICKINPLKHYVLSISENIYELNGSVHRYSESSIINVMFLKWFDGYVGKTHRR
jgi:hypothetical protein